MSKLTTYRARFNKLLTCANRAKEYKCIPSQMLGVMRHKLAINTSVRDYYRYEFYKDERSWEEKARYIATENWTPYWPYEMNHLKYNGFFTNKYLQKAALQGIGVPVARLLTAIGNDYEIGTQEQLASFLDGIESDVVLKPISGCHGTDVLVLSRKGDEFVSGERRFSKGAIWDYVSNRLESTGYLIEEKAKNKQELADIYPLSLNTYRVITVKTNDNKWHVAGSCLKVGRGGSQVDNGSAGGIYISVDDCGKTTGAYDFTRFGPITHHPDTGKSLIGITLEGFQEVKRLSLETSEKLGFLGTMGWDIASTERTPLIIEANGYWEPGCVQIAMGRGAITDQIAAGLRRRHMFSRWDKKWMHPGYWRKH